ncbi:MAG: hypothetical protein ACRCX8_20165 [Sarcina sp.]
MVSNKQLDNRGFSLININVNDFLMVNEYGIKIKYSIHPNHTKDKNILSMHIIAGEFEKRELLWFYPMLYKRNIREIISEVKKELGVNSPRFVFIRKHLELMMLYTEAIVDVM